MKLSKVKLAPVEISIDPNDVLTADVPKWVQVAAEGEYLGYQGGANPFAFTRQVFEELVTNLRAHPSFEAARTGAGSGVVPWDYNHASEYDPTQGSLPAQGAPAQGWTYDLDIRMGTNGKAQLWALTKFAEPALGYVKAGQYQWASVAVSFNSIDPVSGDDVGAVLTSIALTNTPFIEGMNKLVASKDAKVASSMFFEAAGSPEDALESIKRLLGLPAVADASEVAGALAQVNVMAQSGEAPLGVDLDDIFSGLRQILNLPALSDEQTVMAEATKLIPALSDDDDMGQPTDGGGMIPLTNNMKESDMDLLKTLASKLGVRAKEEDVIDAIDEAVALRSSAVSTLSLKKDSNQVILKAAQDGKDADEALAAMLQALGVEDATAALAALPMLMEAKGKLADMATQLESAMNVNVASETASAEAEVAETMAARGWEDPGMKIALRNIRGLSDNPDEAAASKVARLAKGREAFALHYPAVKPTETHLTKTIVQSAPSSVQASSATDTGDKILAAGGKQTADLIGMEGVNVTDQVMSWVKLNVQGGDKMNHDQLFLSAVSIKKTHNVINAGI